MLRVLGPSFARMQQRTWFSYLVLRSWNSETFFLLVKLPISANASGGALFWNETEKNSVPMPKDGH